MRVLLVTALVAGGVGRHVQVLTEGLIARGHVVTVAAPARVAKQFGLAELGARCRPLEVGARPHPLRDRDALGLLTELMAEVDVVHAHGMRAGALAVLASGSRGGRGRSTEGRQKLTPVVVTTHNTAPTGTLSRLLYERMERLVSRRAEVVLGVSADLVERAVRAGARDTGLAVVPAPAQRRVKHEAARARLAAELGVHVETPLVVSVGRLAPQKGFLTLATAFTDVVTGGTGLPSIPEAVLVIAGDGPDRFALEAGIANGEFRGVVLLGPREDVPELLAAADVVVSAAVWEGQPVWLQEALAQSAAIVATDVGGTGMVLAGAAHMLDGPGDPYRLAEAIITVLLEEDLREHLRDRAQARAADLPTIADAIDAVEACYQRVAGAGST